MATIKVDENKMQDMIDNNDKPMIIDFWAPWCGPCKMMGPVFEELSDEYDGKMDFVKVNTMDQQGVAQAFGVRSIPTISVVYKGEEINRFVGFGGKDHLKQNIDKVLASI